MLVGVQRQTQDRAAEGANETARCLRTLYEPRRKVVSPLVHHRASHLTKGFDEPCLATTGVSQARQPATQPNHYPTRLLHRPHLDRLLGWVALPDVRVQVCDLRTGCCTATCYRQDWQCVTGAGDKFGRLLTQALHADNGVCPLTRSHTALGWVPRHKN